MKPLLEDHIFSDSLRYEGHRLIYGTEDTDRIEIGGFLAAAVLGALLYVQSKGGQSAVPKIVGQRLLRTYEQLMNAGEREWSLTDAQKERLGEHLETEYGTLIGLLGDNFHSAVIRMAVQIERIAITDGYENDFVSYTG